MGPVAEVFLGMVALAWTSCAVQLYAEPLAATRDVTIQERFLSGFKYTTVQPEDVEKDAKLPMVVFLHGRADRPHVPRGSFLGIREPMRLIVPQAPEPLGEGYTWLPASIRKGLTPQIRAAIHSRGLELVKFLFELMKVHPTRGLPIVIGFSQGGILAQFMGLHHPEVVGMVITMSSWFPPVMVPEPMPHVTYPEFWAMHGTADGIIAYPRTERAVRTMQEKGFRVVLIRFDGVGHETSDGMRLRMEEWLQTALRRRLFYTPVPLPGDILNVA